MVGSSQCRIGEIGSERDIEMWGRQANVLTLKSLKEKKLSKYQGLEHRWGWSLKEYEMSWGRGGSLNVSINSGIRPRMENFYSYLKNILIKGAVGHRVHLFNLLKFILYIRSHFYIWLCYVYSLLHLLLHKCLRIFIGFIASLIDYPVHVVLPLLEAADFIGARGKSGDRSNSSSSHNLWRKLGIPVLLPRSGVTLCQWWTKRWHSQYIPAVTFTINNKCCSWLDCTAIFVHCRDGKSISDQIVRYRQA